MKFLVLVLVAVLAAGCADTAETPATTPTSTDPGVTTTSTTTSTAPTTTADTPLPPRVPEALPQGIEVDTVLVDDSELVVAVADTAPLRQQGLMYVEDLLDLDGMLFAFEEDNTGGFWMKNTLLSLDIAFFDADGAVVDRFVMDPCTADPCPTYSPAGPYRYALEMAAGTMASDPRSLTFQD